MIEQFIIFAVVGLSGLFLDFLVTWVLKERVRLNKYIANSVGFLTAATSNYYLNRIWTFSSIDPEIAREYFTFLAISVAGLAINTIILYILIERVNLTAIAKESKMRFYLSKLAATAVVTIWNFFMNFFITFS